MRDNSALDRTEIFFPAIWNEHKFPRISTGGSLAPSTGHCFRALAQNNVFLRLEPNTGDPRFITEQFFPRLKPNKGAPRLAQNSFFPRLEPITGAPRFITGLIFFSRAYSACSSQHIKPVPDQFTVLN